MQKILIVEDDPLLQNMYQNFLRHEGFEVTLTANGPEALAYLTKETCNLILLDIMMPGGMNGFDVLMRLKQNPALKDIPVIIMSNLDSERDTGLDMGAVDYFVKANTDLSVLLTKMKQHLPAA
jgi:DNA-binding response OmpR family regulator